jgi:RNA polymerase subunit RPABC4/transcription elongation factor Spt4
MRTCSDCGEELHDLTQPCPTCGSLRQSAAQAGVALVVATAQPATVSASYNSDQPWSAQWLNVRQHLETAEAACRPDSYRGNVAVKRSIENFFTQCFHMGDWLWEDPSTGLTRSQVGGFINSDPSLRVCAGMANTSKHRVSNDPGAITAKIKSISPNLNETEVLIEWTHGANTQAENALDLARRCVVAWDGYLKANTLQPPV